MDMAVKEVAIYVETERIAEVTRVLPLPFQVAPFPFFRLNGKLHWSKRASI